MKIRMKHKNADGVYVEELVQESMVSIYECNGWEIVQEGAKEVKKEEEEIKESKKILSK